MKFLFNVIDKLHISFNVLNSPLVATLDFAFDGGDIVDLIIRHFGRRYIKRIVNLEDQARGLYRQEIGFRFALNQYMGDLRYCGIVLVRMFSNQEILKDFFRISKAQLWKRLMLYVVNQKKYLSNRN